jgi:hypothetical protein
MIVSRPSLKPLRLLVCVSLLAALVAATAGQPALAQGTHLWTQSRIEDFEKGTPDGVAITSDGHLHQELGLVETVTTPSTYVWSVAEDKAGVAYLGTASPATVLRVGKDGKAFTLFETKDVSVQVVRLGPDGALYAATLPSGKIYKLNPKATAKQDDTIATVVFDAAKLDGAKTPEVSNSEQKAGETKPAATKPETNPHYIWDLTFDSAGGLYIATGGPAAVYRIDLSKSGAQPEAFFKSDEAHIRSLAWDAKGNLIAGSDGSGLVYRIDPQGKGYVLFEAPRREITAVAVGPDAAGRETIYAASVGDKSHNPLPPLPVQGIGAVTITIAQPGSLQAANQSASVPEGTEIYALKESQAPIKLWSGKDEIVYALASRPDGLLALSGNRGRVFRIAPDGSFADIAHLDAQQGLSMALTQNSEGISGTLIGTGNTGKLVCLCVTEKHEYASDVLDAGSMARFGRVEIEPGSAGYDLLTRSGNVEQPIRGWSDWTPLKDGVVASPAGRFLQWKAVLHSGASLGSVGVNYLPVNSVPVVDEIVVATGARVSPQNQQAGQPATVNIVLPSAGQSATTFDNGSSTPLQAAKDRTAITVRWAAHDDDGDDLVYSLYLRGDGESVWRLLKDEITEKDYSFDSTLIPDGGYQVKVVASDAPSHTPGDVLTGEKISERFEADTTPPAIAELKAVQMLEFHGAVPPIRQIAVQFDAEDGFSPIAHAEYSLDAGPWQYVEPVGKISDSRREHYSFTIPLDKAASQPNEHLITVRVYDRHDNVGVAKTVVPAQQKPSEEKSSEKKTGKDK